MNGKSYKVLGVMSGTSRDGIDLAYVDFTVENKQWHYVFKTVETLPYGEYWQNKLLNAHTLTEKEIEDLNIEYTIFLAAKIESFLLRNGIQNPDAICSHGHTIFHKPGKGVTLQIGNLSELAELLQQKVVCDFRKQDVQLGGQGAPLVPIGDQLLFPEYAACVNLGGFANISLEKEGKRTAYDICPVNTVLNYYAEKCGKTFDAGGELAKAGKTDHALLKDLNDMDFYRKPPPKSLGIEWVEARVFPLLKGTNVSPKTILATLTEHIAGQVSAACPSSKNDKVLITGGGAFNTYLIEILQNKMQATVVIPEKKLIEYKEALIFGLLGVLKLRGETNVLKSVTGAEKDHSSGRVYFPMKGKT